MVIAKYPPRSISAVLEYSFRNKSRVWDNEIKTISDSFHFTPRKNIYVFSEVHYTQ